MRDFVAGPGRRHPDRPGRVLRLRAGRGGADHRPRRPAARHRRADHRPRHHHRRGDPQVGRRDRRDQPRRGARRPGRRGHRRRPGRRADPGRPAAPAPGDRDAPGDRRAAHRRRQHPRRRARWTPPRSPPSAGCGSTRSASAPRNPTPMVCTAAQLGGRGCSTGRPAGSAAARRRRRPQLPGRRRGRRCRRWRRVTGGEYFAAQRRRPAAGRARATCPRTVATQQRDVEVSVAPWRSPPR